ncbi:hypothetical protein ACH518_06800 [Methylomonas sp. HW2-6]|uniref:hypothetical protein n=1 Tax=Methylomonas sp. HW2-6 TaxID=3376687 RepID=UPI004041ABB0
MELIILNILVTASGLSQQPYFLPLLLATPASVICFYALRYLYRLRTWHQTHGWVIRRSGPSVDTSGDQIRITYRAEVAYRVNENLYCGQDFHFYETINLGDSVPVLYHPKQPQRCMQNDRDSRLPLIAVWFIALAAMGSLALQPDSKAGALPCADCRSPLTEPLI